MLNISCRLLPQVLLHEAQHLEALPCAQMYEKSYMHRDTVTQVATTSTDFFITGEQRSMCRAARGGRRASQV